MNEQQRAVVQQALTWMDEIHPGNMTPMAEEAWNKSRAALRQLLEQPEPVQEPQTFLHWYDNAHWGNEDFKDGCHRSWNAAIKYATPPAQPADHSEQDLDMVENGDLLTIVYMDGLHTGKRMAKREWVGLTEEELYAVRVPMSPEEIARAVEAKLKEKNGGAA
jgi:hypothetical protein